MAVLSHQELNEDTIVPVLRQVSGAVLQVWFQVIQRLQPGVDVWLMLRNVKRA